MASSLSSDADASIQCLLNEPDHAPICVEVGSFERWWKLQHSKERQRLAQQLVESGRLELAAATSSPTASATQRQKCAHNESFGPPLSRHHLRRFLAELPFRNFSSGWLSVQSLPIMMVLSKTLRAELRSMEFSKVLDAELTVRVPWPGFPGLFNATPSGLYRHQLASLARIWELEHSTLKFGALRGGVFGDAPGLGKTVSMIAHIIRTSGTRPRTPASFWDAEAVRSGWDAMRQAGATLRKPVLKSLLPVRRWRDRYPETSKAFEIANGMLAAVERAMAGAEGRTMTTFEAFVVTQIHARLGPAGASPAERGLMVDALRHGLDGIRASMDKRSRRLSQTVAFRRLLTERSLRPTSATLIVVPDPLLLHWATQIRQHMRIAELQSAYGDGVSGNGIVWVDGLGGDLRDVDLDRHCVRLEETLPRADILSGCLVVVSTLSRIRSEANRYAQRGHGMWSHEKSPFLALRWLRLVIDEGHTLADSHAGAGGAGAAAEIGSAATTTTTTTTTTNTAAMRLDGSGGVTAFLAEIAAERRWVMTGTPTTGDPDAANATARDLNQLGSLLEWLRHPEYGLGPDITPGGGILPVDVLDVDGIRAQRRAAEKKSRARWQDDIVKPFLGREEAARQRLVALCRTLLVRHRKRDLTLPKPIFLNPELEVRRAPCVCTPALCEAERAEQDAYALRHGLSAAAAIATFGTHIWSQKKVKDDGRVHTSRCELAFQWAVDCAQANHIVDVLRLAQQQYALSCGSGSGSGSGGGDGGAEAEAVMKGGMSRRGRGWQKDDVDRRSADDMVLSSPRARTRLRKPKVLVFSRSDDDLQSVAEALIQRLGPRAVAEHNTANKRVGAQTSARELSRFCRDRITVRCCPICGFDNVPTARTCGRILLEVVAIADGTGAGATTVTSSNGTASSHLEPGLGSSAVSRSRTPPPAANARGVVEVERRFLVEPERVVGWDHALSPGARRRDVPYSRNPSHWQAGDELVVDLSPSRRGCGTRSSWLEWAGRGAQDCIAQAVASHFTEFSWLFGPLPAPDDDDDDIGVGGGLGLGGGDKSDGDSHAAERRVRVHVVKWAACGRFHGASWYTGQRLSDVPVSTVKENVPVMALYNTGSHGLDLSFVTHIFILEAIHDAALLEQVVSRAHRVGARGPVRVETVHVFVSGDEDGALVSAGGGGGGGGSGSKCIECEPAAMTSGKKGSSSSSSSSRLPTKVCDYCYKLFLGDAAAEAHMDKCAKNPSNMDKIDRFSLVAVFNDVKPPAPTWHADDANVVFKDLVLDAATTTTTAETATVAPNGVAAAAVDGRGAVEEEEEEEEQEDNTGEEDDDLPASEMHEKGDEGEMEGGEGEEEEEEEAVFATRSTGISISSKLGQSLLRKR